MKKKQDLENYVDQATKNIVDDRAATQTLLINLMKYMQSAEDKHREFGLIAAKYLETLQRSNEQLVKLATILQKKETKQDQISDEDRQELFDLIKGEK
tara:strand:- start:3531 stop:3824 length:294 start_codon:yes stop_codon:yes gene_type:complete